VGCRVKGAKTALLRIVAVEGHLTVDRTGRLPGRGANLHPDPRCVDLADKRRAFPRALRLAGPLDVTSVREHVAGLTAPAAPPVHPPDESRSTAP